MYLTFVYKLVVVVISGYLITYLINTFQKKKINIVVKTLSYCGLLLNSLLKNSLGSVTFPLLGSKIEDETNTKL